MSNTLLIVLNLTVGGGYNYSGNGFYQFDLIQIASYSFSLLCCCLLSYYALFRPNDYLVISDDMHLKLHPKYLIDDIENETNDSEIIFKVNITGYKIKQIKNSSIIHYNINISINDSVITISRSLIDFEALDKSLREKFSPIESPNLKFPEFSITFLRNCNIDDRGQALCTYLNALCGAEFFFMTPDLLNFLHIEGNYRDLLTFKHSQNIEERLNSDSLPRAESSIFDYYRPRLNNLPSDDTIHPTKLSGWLINISIPSYRFDETSQMIDFYVKCEIPSLGFEKIKPFKFTDFANFHKTLKKVHSSYFFLQISSKYYSPQLKNKDKDAIESRRAQLEYYLIEIFNDPAYLCKEALDFIGCDAEVNEILELIPDCKYKITEKMSWEGEISEDSSHFIIYTTGIGKKTEKFLEKE